MANVLRLGAALALWVAIATATAAAEPAASDWQAGPKAEVRLVAATTGVGTLASVPIGLEIALAEGWKTYWRTPGEAGIPPHLDWQGSSNLAAADIRWPAPHRFDYFGIDTFGYGERIVFPIDVRPAEVGKPLHLKARVDLLVCEEVCIPHTMNVALALGAGPATPSDHANLIDRFRNQVPGDGARAGLAIEAAAVSGPAARPLIEAAFRSAVPFRTPDLLVEGPEEVAFSRPEFAFSEDGLRAHVRVRAEDAFGDERPLGLETAALTLTLIDEGRAMEATVTPEAGPLPAPAVADGAIGIWAILALALLGGLILNLMPCVLPVLSIKLLSVVGHGGDDPRHVRAGFLATTAGIVFSFLALATALVALAAGGAAVGWGIQFQQPWFIIGLTIIVSLFAANLWGLFEVRLPAWLSDVAVTQSGRGGMVGHFGSGAFATLLATPCTAPFLGTAVGFALSRGPLEIYLVFAALGIGMALPFTAIAVFPALATRLPRPGPWMNWLKKFLSLALVATAVWLLSIVAVQISLTAALVVGVLMIAATAVIAVRRWLPAAAGWLAPAGVAVAAVLALAAPAVLPGDAPTAADAKVDGTVAWQVFDRGAIPGLVAGGKVVFVDVTADWCITCQVNKRRVLRIAEIDTLLAGDGVVAMRADWTRPSDAISRYLASFGRFGIPFNVVYGPDAPRGIVLPELLTHSAVTGAVGTAGRTALAAR